MTATEANTTGVGVELAIMRLVEMGFRVRLVPDLKERGILFRKFALVLIDEGLAADEMEMILEDIREEVLARREIRRLKRLKRQLRRQQGEWV